MKIRSDFHRSLLLLTISLIFTLTYGSNSVRIYSKLHQPVTSSTLNWLPVAHYVATKEIVIGGFQKIKTDESNPDNSDSSIVRDRPLFVCRLQYGGVWVAGIQTENKKQCTVTLLGKVYMSDRYELLENVDNSARLSWIHWDKFHQAPAGTVLVAAGTDGGFVARHVATNEKNNDTDLTYTHYIGTLNTNIGLGTITYVRNNGTEGSTNTGDILVESEPIFYELKSVKLNHWRKKVLKNEIQILGERTIVNMRNEPAKFAEAFSYQYEYLSYWGQGHAMIKALNTSITLVNGTKLTNIEWGLRDQRNRTDLYPVQVYLEPGTAVNVTLKGSYMEVEVPYTGQLVSHYEDDESRTREITAIRREHGMMEVKFELSPVYFTNNQSLVPTTITPPTVRTTGTITTTEKKSSTSTINTSSASTANNIINKSTLVTQTPVITKDSEDENLIIPPRKSDNPMQNDDGGPLSLKNKEDVVNDTSNIIEISIFVLSTSLFISLYRIT